MCGPHSALGLEEAEREAWPVLKERLRRPHHLMALMRGVLGGDTEIAAVAAVSPAGVVQPVAILVTPAIADEIDMTDTSEAGDIRPARIGGDEVEVVLDDATGRPLAILVNSWLFHNLTLYTRKLWSRRP